MPNTISLPPPNSTLLLMHWGEYRSLGLRRMNYRPSQPNRLNFDSSLKWTRPHSSSVHMMSSEANFSRFILFFLEMFRLLISYSTVQIYFIKSSGNSVSWYFNAKVSISSFRDRGCCRKSILFFIHYQFICLPL